MELTTWIITLVLVTLSFRLLFSALLGTWLPSFHIGSIGIFALRDVRWTSRRSGMKVVVDRIGWTPVGSKSCGKGWFVLKFSRVRVLVPQDFLSRPSPPSTKPTPPPMRARTSSNASLPPSYRRPLRLLRKAVRPILKVLYAWASYLSTLISLFALEVSLTVEFENVATVEGTLSAGMDVYRGSRGEWMRVGGWMGVEGVRVREWNAEDSVVPALEMKEMMLVEANAPLDPAMGISGFVSTRGGCVIGKAIVDVELKFGKGKGAQGIMVRVPELERILVALENIKGEKVPVDEEPSMPTTMNPLLFLRSVSVSLPLLVVSAHYDTPLSILESSPRRPLPRAVEFALTLRGFEGSLVLGGNTNEKGTRIDQEHRKFIGRGRDLGVGARFGWKEIEGRVQIDRSGDDVFLDSSKAFAVGPSHLVVTSTWMPSALAASLAEFVCAESDQPPPPRNYNDDIVVSEVHVGHIRGHTKFETLDSALRIFNARARPQRLFEVRPTPPPTKVRGFPRVVGTIASAGVELRVEAPSREGERIPAGKQDRFYRTWTSPDTFCVSFPKGSLSYGGQYEDRSLRRSEAERRMAKRMSRREDLKNGGPVEHDSDHEDHATPGLASHARAKKHPTPEFDLNSRVDPDLRPLQYRIQYHLNAELLNVFILATNQGSSDVHEATSWINDPTAGPSDPIRLEIFSLGPIEVTSAISALGDEGIEPESGRAIGVLDVATRKGEVGVRVEAITVDLWRPVVMGSLRDFLQSFSNALAVSTLRPTSHSSPPRPLVDILPLDISLYLSIASFDLRLAGTDPHTDAQACRGVSTHCGPVILEYLLQSAYRPGILHFANRQSLDLREDLRVESNANLAEKPDLRQALVKLSIKDLHVDPVVNAREKGLSRGHAKKLSVSDELARMRGDWELRNRALVSDLAKRRGSILPSHMKEKTKGVLNLPEVTIRMRMHAAEKEATALDEFVVSVEAEIITIHISLFHVYLALVAISALRSLIPTPSVTSPTRAEFPATPTTSKRPSPLLSVRLQVPHLHAFVTLPHEVKLFVHVRRLSLVHSSANGQIIEWDSLLLAGQSQTVRDKWEDLLRFRVTIITVRPEQNNKGYAPFVVAFDSESCRLRIPFRYVLSAIIDNMSNLIKASKQLHHQLVRGESGSAIEPQIEGAKRMPKIAIKVKMFAVEAQDDPFETRLNIIWRAGCEEQSARLDRNAAFEAKVEAIRRAEAAGGEPSSDEEDEPRGTTGRRHPKANGRHSIGIEEARRDLSAFNSSHWIRRMRNAIAEQGRREEAVTRRLYGPRHHSERPDTFLPVELLPPSRSAPLARMTFHGLNLTLSRHSFAAEHLPDFLHDVGKGLPRDTDFTLLIPMHFSWKMDEARCQLRDYPLPLLHIPPMSSGGGHDYAAWECESDLVIAEEMGTAESVRRVSCSVVAGNPADAGASTYSIVVPRSAMTVKTYATPIVKIRSPFATRIGWGNSVQPAIQDVTKVLDTISKPSPDPSERIGFWDKIRLQLHWRVQVLFEGSGPVHFHIKGTRDPYSLTGFGAGFSKSWRGNVKFLIGLPNPDREFLQIESDEYLLGIPNLREYIDNAATGLARDPGENDDRSTQNSSGMGDTTGRNREADFIKVCAKFINGVRWGLGVVLERTCRSPQCESPACQGASTFHRQCRFFDFKPHWDVHTRTAEAVKASKGEAIDSFAGFRSDFIHFSISLTSPLSLTLPSNCNTPLESGDNHGELGYNSLHFTPQASTHFWAWWKLFDGTMSLPIRQGKLFPSASPPSKKFGKHTATIKYRFSLAPLFISHTYRQESWNDWSKGETNFVGLKGKIGRFNVDLHQREQEETYRKPDSATSVKRLRKTFYRAEVDCDEVDLRAVFASFKESEKSLFVPDNFDLDNDGPPALSADFNLADEDLEWVDLDDFADAIYTVADRAPRVQVLPFIVCPRFTYYRETDARTKDAEGDDEEEEANGPKSKFGTEPSHTCLMGCATDTINVQIGSARARLAELEAEAGNHSPDTKDGPYDQIELRIAAIRRIIERLIQVRDGSDVHPPGPERHESDSSGGTSASNNDARRGPSMAGMDHEDQSGDHLPHITSTMYQQWGEWTNRYMVHNPTIQVNNVTRDVLLKYYYSSRERRGFTYHLSASAIKFLRDLTKEHEHDHSRSWSRRKSVRSGPWRKTAVLEETQQTNRLLDDLLNGGNGGGFWAANESADGGRRSFGFGAALDVDPDSAAESLPDSFDLQPGHLCMFIKPQIALQSDVDDKSTIILTAFRAQLKVYSVVDLQTPDDPVNAHVLSQTFGTLDGLQAFYPREQNQRESRTTAIFVPLETLVDLRVEPWGFDRVVPRTSAALRYDKFNQLRMSSRSGQDAGLGKTGPQATHFQTGTDRVSVECDKFSVSANPDHFAAIYNVVTDLLLYSDPLHKSRSKKLEEVVFTHDFADLAGATEIVTNLQQRIRDLVGLAQQFQPHLDELDDDGRLELFVGRAEFVRLSEELNLVVQAITRAQDLNGASKGLSNKTAGIQFEARASELVWHMLDKSDTPFTKFSVKGVEFSWISKQDSSISNRLIIKDLKALNSSPEQVFAEIIAKHETVVEHELCKVDVFAAVLWNALAPVGGISIVEQFELHLHPIRLQLEHRVGRQILDYLFSQRRSKREADEPPTPRIEKKASRASLAPIRTSLSLLNRSSESLLLPRNGRASSVLASSSSSINGDVARLRERNSSEALVPQDFEEGLDAAEMRARAALYRTFILVDFSSTVLCLTYRSEKADHSRLPDIYNITYTTPSIQYRSKTWSFLDLLNELKRDIIKSVWSQKGALISQLLSKAHRRLPLHDARSAAKKSLTASLKSRLQIKSRGPTPEPIERPPPSPLGLQHMQPSSRPESIASIESDDSASPSPFYKGQPLLPRSDRLITDEPESLSRAASSIAGHGPPEPSSNSLPLPSSPHRSLLPRHAESTPVSAATPDEVKARLLLGESW